MFLEGCDVLVETEQTLDEDLYLWPMEQNIPNAITCVYLLS